MADTLADRVKKLLFTIINNLPWVFLVVMVFALVLILAQVYKLKEAYETGVAIQNECGDEYLERERGDYKVHQVYKTDVRDVLALSFQILTGMVAFTGAGVLIMHFITIFKNYDFNSNANITIFPGNWNPGWLPSKSISQRLVHTVFFMVPAIYITINWFATTFDKANNYRLGGTPLSPLKVSLNSKATMYTAQVTQLVALAAITGIAVLLPMYNSSIQDKFSPNVKNLLWVFTGVFIIAAVVIPTVSYVILRIRGPVDEYETNYTQLNVDRTDRDQEVAIKRNIYRTNPVKGMPDELPTDDDELKSYITHNVNYSDLQAIQIPEQLRPYIHYSSLKGEAVLQLKRDLVAFYNDKNNGDKYVVNLEDRTATASPMHANSTIPSNYDSSLRNTLFKHFTTEYRDLLLKVAGLTSTEKEKKNNLFDTLNEYVITNTSLEKANPFSSATLTKLRQLRESTSIKNSVQSIFSVTSGIIFTILTIILLFIFRYMYSNVPNAGTWISGLIIVLLFLGTSVGFLAKDTWL